MMFHEVEYGLHKYKFLTRYVGYPTRMKRRITIGYKGGMMLEIWIKGNSMMSLSNHVLVLVPIEGRKTIQLDGFKNTRKLEVGTMISCPMISSRTTSDEMGHNPHAPGPAKEQAHSC